MILSVGMIVKNEEKYLRMCLEALKPVLDEIRAELIITDTGSTDKTVEIAREFTDKVLHFEWCNDYSKARNTTIKKAVGEWYMFIDADEILQNPDELIKFFKSGEYKAYDGATIIIRNKDENTYSDFNALRLTKRTRDVKFYYPIHEGLYPVGSKHKNIKAVFEHYGYVTGRAHTRKNKRYIALISENVKKYPKDVRMAAHLTDAYGGGGDNYNALKTALYAISICGKKDYDICVLYEKALRTCHNAGDYFQLIDIAEKYFRLHKKTVVTNINIYMYMIYAYFYEKNYEKVIEYFEKYDGLRNRILNEGFVTEDISSVVLETSDVKYIKILIMLIYSYIYSDKTDSAEKIIDKLYLMNISDEYVINNIIAAVYNIYIKTKSQKVIVKLHNYLNASGRIDLMYKFLCGLDFDDENTIDIFGILYENSDELDIFGIYYLDKIKQKLPHKPDINIKTFPEMIYFFIKYDIPIDEDTKRAACENGRVSGIIYKYDDVCSVLFKGIRNEKDDMFAAVLCEGIFGCKDNLKIINEVKEIYYNTLCSIFESNINENILEENIFAADKITRLRYMYKKFYAAKKNNDESLMNEIKERAADYLPEDIFLSLFC